MARRAPPGRLGGDFGQLCISAVLDEYGGPAEEQSSLNLIYLLGGDASTNSGLQPRSAPELGGADEKWHIHGGNDQLISGILDRLPPGTRASRRAAGRAARSQSRAGRLQLRLRPPSTEDVVADHVVLALPFTTLREVDTSGVSIRPLHRRAIHEEPMGSNAKFFLQYSSRVWDQNRQTGNAYTDTIVQGTLGRDRVPARRGGRPRGAARRHGRPGLGIAVRAAHLPWHAAGADGAGLPGELRAAVPGQQRAYNGKAFYVWSSGDPHIRGAYSYLKVGQYTGVQRHPGPARGPAALRR